MRKSTSHRFSFVMKLLFTWKSWPKVFVFFKQFDSVNLDDDENNQDDSCYSFCSSNRYGVKLQASGFHSLKTQSLLLGFSSRLTALTVNTVLLTRSESWDEDEEPRHSQQFHWKNRTEHRVLHSGHMNIFMCIHFTLNSPPVYLHIEEFTLSKRKHVCEALPEEQDVL